MLNGLATRRRPCEQPVVARQVGLVNKAAAQRQSVNAPDCGTKAMKD
jgi:hypothetical protein